MQVTTEPEGRLGSPRSETLSYPELGGTRNLTQGSVNHGVVSLQPICKIVSLTKIGGNLDFSLGTLVFQFLNHQNI